MEEMKPLQTHGDQRCNADRQKLDYEANLASPMAGGPNQGQCGDKRGAAEEIVVAQRVVETRKRRLSEQNVIQRHRDLRVKV